jgi:NAD(P)H-hydrate epimerase
MILTCSEMKALEERAFADGITAETLMDEAGRQIAGAVRQFAPSAGRCLVFFGKGHNGGDALVAARHLAAAGWHIELLPAFPAESWAELTARKHEQLRVAMGPGIDNGKGGQLLIVLDGLLGIGAGGKLREPIVGATREINRLRTLANAVVFAIDLPTGVDGDNGAADRDAVVADFTLAISCAKRGLLADSATNHVGRLAVLPLSELTKRFTGTAQEIVATAATLAPLLPRRRFDLHKGDCGRVGIVAGSSGFIGAAVMAAEACVHAGAGLVTLHVPPEVQSLVAARVTPEVMVRASRSFLEVLDLHYDALAIGPGLGAERREEILAVIERASQPLVVDADALNLLSAQVDLLASCAGPRLLTPHPGEMARLDPTAPQRSRRATVEEFTSRLAVTLLLKGARTLIGVRGKPLSYNTTGTPGMASGGMGDVLTGVLAALAGQGLELYNAARLGAWLCGRAAEIAITRDDESEESFSATHVIARLGAAFRDLRSGVC